MKGALYVTLVGTQLDPHVVLQSPVVQLPDNISLHLVAKLAPGGAVRDAQRLHLLVVKMDLKLRLALAVARGDFREVGDLFQAFHHLPGVIVQEVEVGPGDIQDVGFVAAAAPGPTLVAVNRNIRVREIPEHHPDLLLELRGCSGSLVHRHHENPERADVVLAVGVAHLDRHVIELGNGLDAVGYLHRHLPGAVKARARWKVDVDKKLAFTSFG